MVLLNIQSISSVTTVLISSNKISTEMFAFLERNFIESFFCFDACIRVLAIRGLQKVVRKLLQFDAQTQISQLLQPSILLSNSQPEDLNP